MRILPTSSDDFEEEDDMKNFFTNKLPSDSKFHFFKKLYTEPEGTLILFQYNNSIVVSGIMEDRKYTMEKGYNGYYIFNKNSINLLTRPISKDELKKCGCRF